MQRQNYIVGTISQALSSCSTPKPCLVLDLGKEGGLAKEERGDSREGIMAALLTQHLVGQYNKGSWMMD